MVEILYGKGSMTCPVEPDAVLTAHGGQEKAAISGSELVRQAMEAPIGSEPLSVLAKGKARATVIISDHTRPVPSKVIIPHMLRQMREGNPSIDITLLVATGFHRPSTREELIYKMGEELYNNCKIVMHDSRNAESNVQIGVLPSGAPLVIAAGALLKDSQTGSVLAQLKLRSISDVSISAVQLQVVHKIYTNAAPRVELTLMAAEREASHALHTG